MQNLHGRRSCAHGSLHHKDGLVLQWSLLYKGGLVLQCSLLESSPQGRPCAPRSLLHNGGIPLGQVDEQSSYLVIFANPVEEVGIPRRGKEGRAQKLHTGSYLESQGDSARWLRLLGRARVEVTRSVGGIAVPRSGVYGVVGSEAPAVSQRLGEGTWPEGFSCFSGRSWLGAGVSRGISGCRYGATRRGGLVFTTWSWI